MHRLRQMKSCHSSRSVLFGNSRLGELLTAIPPFGGGEEAVRENR